MCAVALRYLPAAFMLILKRGGARASNRGMKRLSFVKLLFVSIVAAYGASAVAAPVVVVVVEPTEQSSSCPMGARAFGKLISRLQRARFDSDRNALIAAVSTNAHFTVDQASRILGTLNFDSTKLEALASVAPTLVDAENGWQLLDAFTFKASKEEAAKLLDR